MENVAEATSAAIGGLTSAFLLYPMEITKNRMQYAPDPPAPTFHECFVSIADTTTRAGRRMRT